MGIDAYDYGYRDGVAAERQRIRDWVLQNRQEIEIDEGMFMYRDHFRSESLLEFIDQQEEHTE